MIGKQIKGKSFKGVLDYLEGKVNEDKGEKLDSNMLGANKKELTKEFDVIRAQRSNVQKPVYHVSLSIEPDENLTNQQFREIGEKYLREMGFENSQFIMYRHYDREHPHIHIVANRIDMEGSVVSDRWDYRRSEAILRKIEKEYNLKQVKSSKETREKSLSKGQVEYFRRTGNIPVKKQLQIILREAIKKSGSLKELETELAKNGATIKYHKNRNNKIFGISFELEGITFKGSDIGKVYTYGKIKKQLIENHERNRKTGQGTSRGKGTSIGSASRKASGAEHQKHTRIKNSTGANKYKYEETNYQNTGRIPDAPSGTAANNKKYKKMERNNILDEGNNTNATENEQSTNIQDVPGNDHSWDRNGSIDLHSPISHLKKNNDEEDIEEEKRKKKQKGKKKKGPSF